MPSRRVFLVSICLLGVGCDSPPPSGPIPVHPVNGRVTFKGKPMPDALVVFHPSASAAPKPGDPGSAGSVRPTGRTDAEGRFKLHTYVGDDGAPAGEYRVTVSLANSSENRNVMAKDANATIVIALPPKYADPAQSGLSATVGPGENAAPPFDLK